MVFGDLKRYFYIDPTNTFRFTTQSCIIIFDNEVFKLYPTNFTFTIFNPLYVNRIIHYDKYVNVVRSLGYIESFLNCEISLIKKRVYTWLLCWNRMRWEGINKDMAQLIAKYVLFYRYGKGLLFDR